MKICIYTIAKNEAHQVEGWAENIKDADGAYVLDTGSTDGTDVELERRGVKVNRASLSPFRYDDAFNAALLLVPDCDIAIRLDLDERLEPGWREKLVSAWKPDTNRLWYNYVYKIHDDGSPDIQFRHNRSFHSRYGYRVSGATHEALVKWDGPDKAYESDLTITHLRTSFGLKENDLHLLKRAVKETPTDTRLHFYLGRELFMHKKRDESEEVFRDFLRMPGAWHIEQVHACIYLSYIRDGLYWLGEALSIGPDEPEVHMALGWYHEFTGNNKAALSYYKTALSKPVSTHYLANVDHRNGNLAKRVESLAASMKGE